MGRQIMGWRRFVWAGVGLWLLGVITFQAGHYHSQEAAAVEAPCWVCQLPGLTVPTVPEAVQLAEPTSAWLPSPHKPSAGTLWNFGCCTFTVRAPPQLSAV